MGSEINPTFDDDGLPVCSHARCELYCGNTARPEQQPGAALGRCSHESMNGRGWRLGHEQPCRPWLLQQLSPWRDPVTDPPKDNTSVLGVWTYGCLMITYQIRGHWGTDEGQPDLYMYIPGLPKTPPNGPEPKTTHSTEKLRNANTRPAGREKRG